MPRLLIAASGTGGHIFPALSFANSLSDDWKVYWMGVPDRLEIDLVPKKYKLFTFHVGGLQGSPLKKIFELFKLISTAFGVYLLIRKQNIHAVFTTGGYIAAPAILGAKMSGIPVIIHESNAMPGRVTRLFGWMCNYVALGMSPAVKYLPKCKTIFTGTPVREKFFLPQPLPGWVPSGSGPVIVVMGGSQGAVKLNQMVRGVMPMLIANGCRIIHLTGKNELSKKTKSKTNHPNLIEKTFSDEIPSLLQNADLVISRAGGSAISEMNICASPAILVPFPESTDKHQEFNAAYIAEFGGAVIVHQQESNFSNLKYALINLLDLKVNKKEHGCNYLFLMKENMKRIAKKDSNENIKRLFNKII